MFSKGKLSKTVQLEICDRASPQLSLQDKEEVSQWERKDTQGGKQARLEDRDAAGRGADRKKKKPQSLHEKL